jgi:MYXO-CTERM domain-containing protein
MVDAIEEFRYGTEKGTEEEQRCRALMISDAFANSGVRSQGWAGLAGLGALGSWRRFRVVKALIKMKRAYQFRCSE